MKLLPTLLVLSLTITTAYASRSTSRANTDLTAVYENLESSACGVDIRGTQVGYELEVQKNDIANAIMLLAGTKDGGNYRGNSFEGCVKESEMSADFFMKQLDLKSRFNKIARKIKRLFPTVDLKDNLDQTVVCETESRLEKILGGQYDEDRTMAWMPKYKNSSDYIMYNNVPASNSKEQRDELSWALIKELLHNHVQGGDYHVRDVQLQLIVKSLKAYIEDDSITEKELRTITTAFSFPITK